MKLLKVGAAVLNQTPLDWANNRANMIAAIEQARLQSVSILCLPELCITGYGCEDAFHAAGLRRMAQRVLMELLPLTKGMVVTLGLPIRHQHGLYNAVAVVVDGRIAGFVAKRHLAGDGLHYEPRWFKAWPEVVRSEIELNGQRYPFGDIHFDVSGIRIGLEICEDAWVAQRPGGSMARRGIDVILNPSASHFAFDKLETRKRFVIEGSRAFGCTYIYSNFLGNEAGRVIYDGGAMIASGGQLMAMGPRLAMDLARITTCVVDVDQTRMNQMRTTSFVPRVGDDPQCVAVDFQWPVCSPELQMIEIGAWEKSDHHREEEFTRAITLALLDYMRKSRSHGFVVSLSGGADSAAVTCLVRLMVQRALQELGVEGLRQRLHYLTGPATDDADAWTERLLTCVYQATANSSQTTLHAAQSLAQAIGARFHHFDVEPLVEGYVNIVEQSIGRALSWERDDITLQNIQARVRAPGCWMLANLNNALLLATSNRSEAAVGYTTMDGDTCGGLSPIGGIDKAFLRQYLRWLETTGPQDIGPIPALSLVNAQQPTAELRPASEHQTDEADLMPYDLLDAVESAAIGRKQTPTEVYQLMRVEFPQYTANQLMHWIDRFFRLWCRNQWKRERYAPSFHVDDLNLDPRSWCRFPILSGGFEDELMELKTAGEGLK
jgi:NAD+ synthase (glutamine-hydrolysing)